MAARKNVQLVCQSCRKEILLSPVEHPQGDGGVNVAVRVLAIVHCVQQHRSNDITYFDVVGTNLPEGLLMLAIAQLTREERSLWDRFAQSD